MKVLFLSKTTDWCNKAKDYILKNFDDVSVFQGEWDDVKSKEFFNWQGEYIISYLSPWIVLEDTLKKVSKKAINFHPGTPKYGGIGGYNFAIYNQESEYGVLCHEMAAKVDSGAIIKVRYFPITNDETVRSLKEKAMKHLFELFIEIIDLINEGKELPTSDEQWQKKPYTRKEFQKLCKITKDMSLEEKQKRFRATYYPGARDFPYIEENGKKIAITEMPK